MRLLDRYLSQPPSDRVDVLRRDLRLNGSTTVLRAYSQIGATDIATSRLLGVVDDDFFARRNAEDEAGDRMALERFE